MAGMDGYFKSCYFKVSLELLGRKVLNLVVEKWLVWTTTSNPVVEKWLVWTTTSNPVVAKYLENW